MIASTDDGIESIQFQPTDFAAVDSSAQSELMDKVPHLVPLCGPRFPFPDRPAAVMEIVDSFMARVCAWHDGGKANAAATKWCTDRGYDVTHTACPDCEKRALADLNKLLS